MKASVRNHPQSTPVISATPSKRPSKAAVFGVLAFVQLLFGINYLTSKVTVQFFPPLLWASVRCFAAAILLVGLALVFRRPHPPVQWKFFGPLIVFSLLGVILNQGFFLVGLYYTTPTNSAILNTLIPLFAVLLITLRGQEKLTRNKALGFGLGLVGILVVEPIENFALSNDTLVGDLLTISNCVSYALFLAFSKRFIMEHDSLWTTAWLFICGTVGLGALSLPTWHHFEWPSLTTIAKVCALYTIIGATLLSYLLNMWALSHAEASEVAVFIYIQPVVASLLSFLLWDTNFSPRTALASLLIFGAVYLAVFKKEKILRDTKKSMRRDR